jgi:hypothetical protein
LTDEERAWLRALQTALWPKSRPKDRFEIDASRPLTFLEFERVRKLIETRGLVTSMFSSSMFGGYGMDVYEHEPFPGTGPLHLLRLVEGNHPDPHPLEVSETGYDRHIRKPGGVGRDDAWESFSKFTHSERNREWLQGYMMDLPKERSYYDY